MQKQLKAGDRARLTFAFQIQKQKGINEGDTCTILDDTSAPFIRMDNYNEGLHDANGLCEPGHGAVTFLDNLEPLEEEQPRRAEWKTKKGDRVRVVRIDMCTDVDTRNGIKIGDTGTVLDGGYCPWVRMDNYYTERGSCGGLCEDGHGVCLVSTQIELVEQEATITEQQAIDLLKANGYIIYKSV